MEILQKLGSLPIFILMFVVIYFLMIRPQSVQQKKHQKLLSDLKKGDKVITRGGLTGKIVDRKRLPRLGLRGTARLEGRRVLLAYWLFRRPISALRQFIGF